MKKLLLLLLLVSAGVQAQLVIGNDTIATQSWVRKTFGGGVIDPGIEDCDKHPTIYKIFDVTATSAKVQFDAKGLTEFQLSFQTTAGKEISFQRYKDPAGNTVTLNFTKQAIGDYQIELIPISCKSAKANDIKSFRLTDGGVSPPVGECKPFKIDAVKYITNSGASFVFDAEKLTDFIVTLLSPAGTTIKSIPYHPEGNELYFPFNVGNNLIVPAGEYQFRLTPVSCTGQPVYFKFTVKNEDSGGVVVPPSRDASLLGSYKANAGGREFTFLANEKFKLSFNADGTISDATPGLDKSGSINQIDGKNVFYMIGYSVFGDTKADYKKSYNKFQNIKLPDGIYVVKQIITSGFNNIDDFIKDLDNGVNTDNSVLSQIFLSIKTGSPEVNETNWLRATRKLVYPTLGINFKADGTFGSSTINAGGDPLAYQRMGVNTDLIFRDNGAPQPNTFRVLKWPTDGFIASREELYRFGYGFAQQYGFNRNTIMYDEIPENSQNKDPNIYSNMPEVYRGALDYIRQSDPNVDVKDTKLYGPYGGDDFTGTISTRFLISQSRDFVLKSLTTNVHDVSNGGSFVHPSTFYQDGHIDVRNVNLNLYMYNSNWQLPYQLAITNERIKVGTKTWQGKDRERNWQAIAATTAQSLVMSADGTREVGLEYSSTRDLIPFPNGEIVAKNLGTPGLWDEFQTAGFYTTFLGGGFSIWGGWNIGTDSTRFAKQYWYEQSVSWVKNGGSQETYVPGKNGAPMDSEPGKPGIEPSSQASPTDAAYSGWLWAKSIKGRSKVISHAPYTSSRGAAIPTPGQAGLHLNGFGVLNWGLMATKDLYDAHKGLMLVGEGPEGMVAVYYNGFLSQHETETDLTLEYKGKKYNFGTVYGRKIYTFNL